jgi:hypothetical protein
MILDAIKKVSFFHVYTENHTKEGEPDPLPRSIVQRNTYFEVHANSNLEVIERTTCYAAGQRIRVPKEGGACVRSGMARTLGGAQ